MTLEQRIEEAKQQLWRKLTDSDCGPQSRNANEALDTELRTLAAAVREEGYEQGFRDGVRAYAWYKDGHQEVGTTGRTLKDALEKVKETWNYAP